MSHVEEIAPLDTQLQCEDIFDEPGRKMNRCETSVFNQVSENDYISVPLKTIDLNACKFLEFEKKCTSAQKSVSADKENKG